MKARTGAWKKSADNDAYAKSPFHMPPLLAGGSDQVIDEVTGGLQFVQLGYQVVRHPRQTLGGMWTAVKQIKPTDVRKLIITDEAIANYTTGGDLARHQGGKDGVRVAMMVFTVWKSVGKTGREILEKGGDEIDDIVKGFDNFDELAKKGYREAVDGSASDLVVKEITEAGEESLNALENALIDATDIAVKKGRKLTWDEVKALFKRGNDFNAKARTNQWYRFDEVVIEHPTLKYADGSPRRFRLDSYNPNDVIVSRKATDLANIQKTTFESYLKELIDKYPVGAKIVNQDRPGITATLQGKFVLEIPASNANYSALSDYRQIASNFTHNGKSYNIKIELKSE